MHFTYQAVFMVSFRFCLALNFDSLLPPTTPRRLHATDTGGTTMRKTMTNGSNVPRSNLLPVHQTQRQLALFIVLCTLYSHSSLSTERYNTALLETDSVRNYHNPSAPRNLRRATTRSPNLCICIHHFRIQRLWHT